MSVRRPTLSQAKSRQIAALHSAHNRGKQGLSFVEGVRAIEAALEADVVHFIAVAGGFEGSFSLQPGVEMFEVSRSHMREISNCATPPGCLAVVDAPQPATLDYDTLLSFPRWLVLDGIQSPGNLGALLRIAAGLGPLGVVVTQSPGLFTHPEALRGSAGTVWRVPALAHADGGSLPILLAETATECWIADPHHGEPLALAKPGERWALVVGSEASGVGPWAGQTRPASRGGGVHRVRIELAEADSGLPEVESLNVAVAAGILAWQFAVGGAAKRADT